MCHSHSETSPTSDPVAFKSIETLLDPQPPHHYALPRTARYCAASPTRKIRTLSNQTSPDTNCSDAIRASRSRCRYCAGQVEPGTVKENSTVFQAELIPFIIPLSPMTAAGPSTQLTRHFNPRCPRSVPLYVASSRYLAGANMISWATRPKSTRPSSNLAKRARLPPSSGTVSMSTVVPAPGEINQSNGNPEGTVWKPPLKTKPAPLIWSGGNNWSHV